MVKTVQLQAADKRVLNCIYAPEAQRIGNQKITLKDNHSYNVDLEGGAEKYHGLGQAVFRFLGSAEGLFRFGQLAERLPKFTNALRQECGLSRLEPLDRCTSKSAAAWSWLTTIPRAVTMTPGVIADVKDAAGLWNDKSQNSSQNSRQKQYRYEKAVREATDLCTMYGYSIANIASLFPSMSKIGASAITLAESTTCVHDVVSFRINESNYRSACALDLTEATPAMKETVEGTKAQALIAMAKDVVSFVSGFFGLLFFATGVRTLPAMAFVTMSLFSTVLAVARKLHEETMHFRPISFFDHKQVSLVTA